MPPYTPPDLRGRVALVAGATRGAGRGIALELGAAGACVYCSGRSTRAGASDMGRPETLEDTAEAVAAAGGEGVAVRTDHTVEGEVAALVERIVRERGRLDLLVNDVWGGDPLSEWGTPFWQLDLGKARRMFERAVWSHLVTARYAAAPMVARGSGLIVEITDGDSERYRGNLSYDLSKAAAIRLAFGMAAELRPHGVVAVALTPGFLRSEAVLEHFGVHEENWRDAVAVEPTFAGSETPRFVGRAVAALAADPEVAAHAGAALSSWGLARRYGFPDADGRRPDWGAFFEAVVEGGGAAEPWAE